jgi:hypothetical protein
MKQEIELFNREKTARVKQEKRKATSGLQPIENAPPPVVAGYTMDDLNRRLGGIRVPTLPRMLAALMNDIADQAGLTGGAVHSHSDLPVTAAGIKVCSLNVGYNLIDVRDPSFSSEGGAHAIAAEIRTTETRLFDPNHGEWVSVPPDNAWTSFSVELGNLLLKYKLRAVNTLSVLHFKLPP